MAYSVAAGDGWTCVLARSGTVSCWGDNHLGTLGQGTVDSGSHATPSAVTGGQSFAALAGGGSFACALTAAGQPWCWGATFFRQNASPSRVIRDSVPTVISGAPALHAVAVGSANACGVTSSGDAYCWGNNAFGELGTGDTTDRSTATIVPGGTKWAAISVGFDHTCALQQNGAAYCWGDNTYGMIATPANPVQPTPVLISGAAFTSISAGADYTCGVTLAPGNVGYCWGINNAGQLGDSTVTNRVTPVVVAGAITFGAIYAERENSNIATTCALSAQLVAYCWGGNLYSQLGSAAAVPTSCSYLYGGGTVPCVLTPVAVAGGLNFTNLAVGNNHVCGVTPTGAVYCWGQNDHGQLGTTSIDVSQLPIRIPGFGTS
jgi:alpha-tubulin suppressor-like RCC1 family protein